MYTMIPFNTRKLARSFFNDDLFRPFMQMNDWMGMNGFRVDIREQDGAYVLDAELPGFKKEDIKIDVENDCLTISAERKLDEEEKQKNFIKRERFYGSFSRSFDVSGVNVDGIEAAYNDGVLKLTMPKKVETVPPTRRLEIK